MYIKLRPSPSHHHHRIAQCSSSPSLTPCSSLIHTSHLFSFPHLVTSSSSHWNHIDLVIAFAPSLRRIADEHLSLVIFNQKMISLNKFSYWTSFINNSDLIELFFSFFLLSILRNEQQKNWLKAKFICWCLFYFKAFLLHLIFERLFENIIVITILMARVRFDIDC